ncbi:MAG: alpha-amylase family glycosyl hydrolase [Caldilineaceae bacterium]
MIRFNLLLRTSAILVALSLLLGCTMIQPLPSGTPSAEATPAVTAPPEGQAWWNEAIFYEIFVRSFYDSNGDGNGDLNGIIERLDYLNDGNPQTNTDLGVTALWLMPIQPSTSYHGYDITDYYNVNPDYGTLDDFKHLVSEAHKRGIHVVIDYVANHTSIEHPWFQQSQEPASKYRNWYIWSEKDPGNRGPWGQDVWHHGASGYYYGVFWERMPDLNYKTPEVANEMENVARFWLEKMGSDGLRVDGAGYLVEDNSVLADSESNHAWFKHLRTVYKAINPNLMSVGEVWTDDDIVSTYAQGDEFDLVFDFDLASALVRSVQDNNADAARSTLTKSLKLLPTAHSAIFLTNHDQNRVMDELNGDVNKAKRAATLLLTLPGTPFLYYGEEIGLLGRKPDENLRRPMQWSGDANAGFSTVDPWRAPAVDFSEKNVAAQTGDGNSLLSHYRYLITLRNQEAALRTGTGYSVSSTNHAVLAYLRAADDQAILVINNLRDEFQDNYNLSMENGPFTPGATYHIEPLWGAGPFAQVVATDTGGFALVQPNAGLNSGETLILRLIRD